MPGDAIADLGALAAGWCHFVLVVWFLVFSLSAAGDRPSAIWSTFRLNVLQQFRDRLWVPYQVGLEFQRNRLEIIEPSSRRGRRTVAVQGPGCTAKVCVGGCGLSIVTTNRTEGHPRDASLPRRVGGVRSVSYTHLRAHETVLDLVCRLLLEKT